MLNKTTEPCIWGNLMREAFDSIYGSRKRYNPEKASFIEEGIRPLVVALSRYHSLALLHSCEGHQYKVPSPPYAPPYVTFIILDYKGRNKIINEIRKRINGTGWGLFNEDPLDCEINIWVDDYDYDKLLPEFCTKIRP